MYDIPEDVIIQIGIKDTSRYFEELFLNKRIDNKVAVLVEDFATSLFFVECDKQGYPMRKQTDYLTFMENPFLTAEDDEPFLKEAKVYKKTIEINKPLIYRNVMSQDIFPKPYFFLWEGIIVDKRELSIEELDVKRLLKLAQETIKNREGLIIDDVLKNRLIK